MWPVEGKGRYPRSNEKALPARIDQSLVSEVESLRMENEQLRRMASTRTDAGLSEALDRQMGKGETGASVQEESRLRESIRFSHNTNYTAALDAHLADVMEWRGKIDSGMLEGRQLEPLFEAVDAMVVEAKRIKQVNMALAQEVDEKKDEAYRLKCELSARSTRKVPQQRASARSIMKKLASPDFVEEGNHEHFGKAIS